MEPTDGPTRFKLETLLAEGVQPFPDMDFEQFEELKLSIKQTGLQDPISLTEDGLTMFDGHQRCRALLALGRKTILATDVRIVPGVTRENIWERSIAKNSVRRHLSPAAKAQAMHKMAGRGWSQRKIARAFGMSQPGVSKLMVAHPAAEGTPISDVTEGADGKVYKRPEPREPEPVWEPPRHKREPVHPWAAGGDVGKALRKVWAATSAWSADTVRAELTDREWSETRQLIHEAVDSMTRWAQEPSKD